MKDNLSDLVRLMHIADAIGEIQNYTEGFNLESFSKDSKTRFASIKQLEIIGEAAYHISEQTKLNTPQIQWQPIISLRHILVHEYYGIQDDVLWRIITVHVPEFSLQINQLIAGLKKTGE